MFKIISFIVILFLPFIKGEGILFSQTKAIQYDKDFEFKDGIYLFFDDFKNNSPTVASKLITKYNKDSRDFYDNVLSKSTFAYIDKEGKEVESRSKEAWGYCQNGIVYINHGTNFNRMTIMGSICHFIATVPVRIGTSDPFYYDYPLGTPPRYTYVSEQFILDFDSGSILSFNVDNMEKILMRDEILYKEFSVFKKKKKRDSIFLYLRKYNEKHPIFFPI